MLKEIKARYENPCHKCQRVIKVGWTAFYEPEGKLLYCKPCGEVMLNQQEAEATQSPDMINISLEQLATDLQTNNELVGTMMRQQRDMAFQVAEILAWTKLTDKPKSTKKT